MLRILLAILILFSSTMNGYCVTQWNVLLPNAGDNKSAWPAAVQAQWSIMDTLLSNYKRGLGLNYVSSSTLSVSVGETVASNVGGTIRLFLQNNSVVNVTATNLDTGSSFSAATQYYVYCGTSTATDSACTYYISLSNSAPTGVTYYALIGSFLTDGSANIANIQTKGRVGLGTVTNQTAGTIYQAPTDGFVYVSGAINDGFTNLYSDGTSSPSKLVGRFGSSNSTGAGTISYPIKAGQYYQLTNTSTLDLYIFTPLSAS